MKKKYTYLKGIHATATIAILYKFFTVIAGHLTMQTHTQILSRQLFDTTIGAQKMFGFFWNKVEMIVNALL